MPTYFFSHSYPKYYLNVTKNINMEKGSVFVFSELTYFIHAPWGVINVNNISHSVTSERCRAEKRSVHYGCHIS